MDGYEISTDPARLDRALIHRWLDEESYWARGRTRAVSDRAIEHSLCFGLYAPDGSQAGFGRLVTDRAIFAYLADVFVLPGHRGQGLGLRLVQAMLDHPEVATCRQFHLGTADAHELYARFGFVAGNPELDMVLLAALARRGLERPVSVEVTFCVVNTAQRELLLRGLDAIARERTALDLATEVLVLDNASGDGSAEAARAHPAVDAVVALDRRAGKAENDSTLLARARGRYALLLNEDSELLPGATAALHGALQARPDAAAAGAALLRPDGTEQPSAWAFPSLGAALAQALLLHRRLVVQSRGTATREVDWCQSAALLVRRDASAAIGHLDPEFFVYGDEVDFQRRLRDAGHAVLWVPGARAIHHEQLATGSVPRRRIVELSRNRERYLRKHHGRGTALAARPLYALPYVLRALAALVLPGHSPGRYWAHVGATLAPGLGEGLREVAERYNAASPAS